MMFERYIGIDYSGAATPDSRLKTLQVYRSGRSRPPHKVLPPQDSRQWSRRDIAAYCKRMLLSDAPVIIGIDHGFSFPSGYMQRYGLADWDAFLSDFVRHWPTLEPDVSVESLRRGNRRVGDASELRLCEQWTATAKSVFLFDVQGSVAKSTHAGLPWLHALRQEEDIRSRVHFWPFDGFQVPAGRSVIAEAYPALYKRRYPRAGRTPDEQDAWSVAAWLREADRRGTLEAYFNPPLIPAERTRAVLEGWILGVW
jgi:hypothetical protein